MSEERYRGVKIRYHEGNGKVYALGGGGAGVGATREEARGKLIAWLKPQLDDDKARAKEASTRVEIPSVRCECGSYVKAGSLGAHRRSAKHENAMRYENYRRTTRY
jgi:hypothetical protein